MLLEKQVGSQREKNRVAVGSHYNVTLRGFTLMELIVSMLLLGMLVILGGYVYSTFLQIQQRYQVSVDQAYDVALVQFIIQKDANHAITYTQPTASQICLEGKQSLLCYTLTDSLFIRSADAQHDTVYFQGQWQALDRRRFRLHDHIHQISYSFTLPKRAHYERN